MYIEAGISNDPLLFFKTKFKSINAVLTLFNLAAQMYILTFNLHVNKTACEQCHLTSLLVVECP